MKKSVGEWKQRGALVMLFYSLPLFPFFSYFLPIYISEWMSLYSEGEAWQHIFSPPHLPISLSNMSGKAQSWYTPMATESLYRILWAQESHRSSLLQRSCNPNQLGIPPLPLLLWHLHKKLQVPAITPCYSALYPLSRLIHLLWKN